MVIAYTNQKVEKNMFELTLSYSLRFQPQY